MNTTLYWLAWGLAVGLFLLCLFAKLYIPSAAAQLPPVSRLVLPLLVLMVVGVIRLLLATFKDRVQRFNLSRILYPELDPFETPEGGGTALEAAVPGQGQVGHVGLRR